MINQKLLTILGMIARSVRLIGLGPLLQIIRDFVDLSLLKLGKLPLKIYLDGRVLYGCFRHRSFLHHLSTGAYESFTAELFKRSLRPGMTVVDGGAHIGFYTLLAAELVGTNGRVFSFEPDSYNFPCLTSNVCKNKYQNVTVIQKAVANKVENTILYQSSSTISSSLGNRIGMRNFFKGTSIKRVSIQSTTLDSELQNSPVDVIKLDIEGAETLALMGMPKTLQANRSLILFLEINPSALQSVGTSSDTLIMMLKSLGSDVYFIDEVGRRLLPITGESNIQKKGMLYCTKGD
jgi:FkbM family methyltransferase